MASEGLANVSLQIPLALARRLDAKCEIERKTAPGTGSRSNVIRVALEQFLADVPDPKEVPERTRAASSERREQASMASYKPKVIAPPRRKREVVPAPAPIRTRTRPAPLRPAE